MRTKWIEWGLCAGLLLSGGAVLADGSPPGGGMAQHEAGDREFLDTALGVNQLELQLGQLAAQRATTAEVKAMGMKMVEKHTELGQQLAELSRQAGGTGQPDLTADERAIYSRVSSQSGGAFDSVFKEVVDTGHVKELAMYRAEVSRAKSPALRELAQRRVAKLEETVAQAKPPAPKPKAEPEQDW
jgi:putative membrane protein